MMPMTSERVGSEAAMEPSPQPAPAPPPPVKPLAAAETAVRRFLLMVGFGFIAYVGGSMIAASVMTRMAMRLEGASEPVQFVAWLFISSAWVLLALPGLSGFAARFLDLKPWSTAIIGASTGLMFQLALQYVSGGADGIVGDPVRQLSRLAATAAGIVLTVLAVKRGRELARLAEEQARVEAEKKKSQYDEFVKQAEELANRREAVPISPVAPVSPQPPAEESPLPSAEGQGEGTSGKTS